MPVYLPQHLLEPTVIFGTVFDKETGDPIPGAELILSEAINKPTSFSGSDSLSMTKIMPMAKYFANLERKGKRIKSFIIFNTTLSKEGYQMKMEDTHLK